MIGHRGTATYIDSKRSDLPVYQPSNSACRDANAHDLGKRAGEIIEQNGIRCDA